jgi:hypothetical protein
VFKYVGWRLTFFLFYFEVTVRAYWQPGRAMEGCRPPPAEGAPWIIWPRERGAASRRLQGASFCCPWGRSAAVTRLRPSNLLCHACRNMTTAQPVRHHISSFTLGIPTLQDAGWVFDNIWSCATFIFYYDLILRASFCRLMLRCSRFLAWNDSDWFECNFVAQCSD